MALTRNLIASGAPIDQGQMIDVMPLLQLQNQIDQKNASGEFVNADLSDGFNKSMSPLNLLNNSQSLQVAGNSAGYLGSRNAGQGSIPMNLSGVVNRNEPGMVGPSMGGNQSQVLFSSNQNS